MIWAATPAKASSIRPCSCRVMTGTSPPFSSNPSPPTSETLPLRAGNDLSPSTILAMASLDPRAAVELVERLPKARSLSINDPTNWARQTLADHLAMPPDRRWMRIWRFYSGCGIAMFEEVYRDL